MIDARTEHITKWMVLHKDDLLSPEENWKRGEAAWEALTPEQQWFVWSLSTPSYTRMHTAAQTQAHESARPPE